MWWALFNWLLFNVFIGLWLWVFIRRRMKTLMALLRNPCLRINSNDSENKEGRVMAQMEIIQCRKHRAGGRASIKTANIKAEI